MQREVSLGSVYSVWCSYMSRFLFWLSSNRVVKGILSSIISHHYILCCSWTIHVSCVKKTDSSLTRWDSHLTTNLLAVCVRNDSCCQGLHITFFHFHPSGEKGNLCIILKPIVAYLVGREHAFPTGRAFVCGSASFKFSFIPALLPTLWPIISCNIGHPGLCEAPAPFAFLIQM